MDEGGWKLMLVICFTVTVKFNDMCFSYAFGFRNFHLQAS